MDSSTLNPKQQQLIDDLFEEIYLLSLGIHKDSKKTLDILETIKNEGSILRTATCSIAQQAVFLSRQLDIQNKNPLEFLFERWDFNAKRLYAVNTSSTRDRVNSRSFALGKVMNNPPPGDLKHLKDSIDIQLDIAKKIIQTAGPDILFDDTQKGRKVNRPISFIELFSDKGLWKSAETRGTTQKSPVLYRSNFYLLAFIAVQSDDELLRKFLSIEKISVINHIKEITKSSFYNPIITSLSKSGESVEKNDPARQVHLIIKNIPRTINALYKAIYEAKAPEATDIIEQLVRHDVNLTTARCEQDYFNREINPNDDTSSLLHFVANRTHVPLNAIFSEASHHNSFKRLGTLDPNKLHGLKNPKDIIASLFEIGEKLVTIGGANPFAEELVRARNGHERRTPYLNFALRGGMGKDDEDNILRYGLCAYIAYVLTNQTKNPSQTDLDTFKQADKWLTGLMIQSGFFPKGAQPTFINVENKDPNAPFRFEI